MMTPKVFLLHLALAFICEATIVEESEEIRYKTVNDIPGVGKEYYLKKHEDLADEIGTEPPHGSHRVVSRKRASYKSHNEIKGEEKESFLYNEKLNTEERVLKIFTSMNSKLDSIIRGKVNDDTTEISFTEVFKDALSKVDFTTMFKGVVTKAKGDIRRGMNILGGLNGGKLDDFKFNTFGADFKRRWANEGRNEDSYYNFKERQRRYSRSVNTDESVDERLKYDFINSLHYIMKSDVGYKNLEDDFEPSNMEEIIFYRMVREGLTTIKPIMRLIHSLTFAKIAKKYCQFYMLDKVIVPMTRADPDLRDIDVLDMWTGRLSRRCSSYDPTCFDYEYPKATKVKMNILQKKLDKIKDKKNYDFIDPIYQIDSKYDVCSSSVRGPKTLPLLQGIIIEIEDKFVELDTYINKIMDILRVATRQKTAFAMIKCTLGDEVFKNINKSRGTQDTYFENMEKDQFEEYVSFYINEISSTIDLRAQVLINLTGLSVPPS